MARNRPSSTGLVDTMTAHKVIPRQKTHARRNTRGEKKKKKTPETTLAKVAHDIAVASQQKVYQRQRQATRKTKFIFQFWKGKAENCYPPQFSQYKSGLHSRVL